MTYKPREVTHLERPEGRLYCPNARVFGVGANVSTNQKEVTCKHCLNKLGLSIRRESFLKRIKK